MYASFNRFELKMTKGHALQGSHQGQCYPDVVNLSEVPYIRRQLDKINPDDIRAELKEYGAWDEVELSNNEENRYRIVWIAAGNIVEENRG